MSLHRRLNISNDQMDAVKLILGLSPLMLDESIRNMTMDDKNSKGVKKMPATIVPYTPNKIANKAKREASTIVDADVVDENIKAQSTVIESLRRKLAGLGLVAALVSGNIPSDAPPENKNTLFPSNNIKLKSKNEFKLIPGEDAKKIKDKADKDIKVKFENYILEAQASSTHTGKIKSSKRIMKSLQVAAEQDKEIDFTFGDGSTQTIQPALAKMAIRHYNSLSEFEKAETAKLMRNSYKEFLSAIKQ
ncbi:MAG: hypothetical protein NTZ20_04755 [Candidatus Levybacteria bacterium]|nr:hypothetical protein [Candidatus Levybacteria bacterium]